MARKIKIDNAELKRRQYQKRTHAGKDITCRILIVCEGSKTEPQYFNSFEKKWGTVVLDLKLDGGEGDTIQVVRKAIDSKERAEKNGQPFDRVWAVFDKDSFPDVKFNAAILQARKNDIGCAWSNEAFELWYLLHFCDRITPMKRTDYESAISEAVNGSPLYKERKAYVYRKNDAQSRMIMTTFGSQDDAIHRAENLEKDHNDMNYEKYAKHNPCTIVYKLVRQLIGKDEELNRELIEKGNMK